MHCKTVSSIPGLYILDASSTLPPVMRIKNVSGEMDNSVAGERIHKISLVPLIVSGQKGSLS